MTEIERAISEIVNTNYGEVQCHRETMILAVQALQEKAERDKGCEYCIGAVYTNLTGRVFYKPLSADSISNQGEMCLAYDKDGWSIHFEDDDTGVMCDALVSTCPNCGRRLEEQQ